MLLESASSFVELGNIYRPTVFMTEVLERHTGRHSVSECLLMLLRCGLE